MEASAGPWRCLNVTWNLRPHHTRKASRRALGRGHRFRSSLGNGNGSLCAKLGLPGAPIHVQLRPDNWGRGAIREEGAPGARRP